MRASGSPVRDRAYAEDRSSARGTNLGEAIPLDRGREKGTQASGESIPHYQVWGCEPLPRTPNPKILQKSCSGPGGGTPDQRVCHRLSELQSGKGWWRFRAEIHQAIRYRYLRKVLDGMRLEQGG